MGFSDDEQVASWCLGEDIRPPEESLFSSEPTVTEPKEEAPPPKPKKKSTASKKPPRKQSSKLKDPTWVPAAERSRKVKGRLPEVKAKKVSEEDEELSKSSKKSDTQ